MSALPLVLELILVFVLVAYLVHYYGDWKKQHVVVTIATFISWYFSCLIIFTIPLDVTLTVYRQCLADSSRGNSSPTTIAPPSSINPSSKTTLIYNATEDFLKDTDILQSTWRSTLTTSQSEDEDDGSCEKPYSYVPDQVLPALYHVVYWTTQSLTWLIIPIMQSYSKAGEFTALGKLKAAVINNAIYYGTYLIIFIICLIYLLVKPGFDFKISALKPLAITASNTWGLTLLVLMWGYGLVEVPRRMWHNSFRGRSLANMQFKIAKLSIEKTEAEEELEDTIEEVRRAADKIRYNHPLRPHLETILEKCPDSVREALLRSTRQDFQDYDSSLDAPTEKALVSLHRRLIQANQAHQRTQGQWIRFTERAFELEDIAASEGSALHVFKRSKAYAGKLKDCYSPRVEWYWKCLARPWGLRILSVLLMAFSVIVVWSECLFFIVNPVLSIFAIFLNLASEEYKYIAIYVMCMVTLMYLCACAFYTVFKVRFFNFYYLAGHHHTSEYSLLFCAMMLCRLTPPLCLNFLGLVHLDSHITKDEETVETYFTQIMGHMDVIKFISEGFNIYFPIAIVVLCIATVFNLCQRALHCLGFQQFIGDDELTQELVEEGRNLVIRERRKRDRNEESATRRRDWTERLGRSTQVPATAENEIPRASRQVVSKTAQENDRSNLLKLAEPIAYSTLPSSTNNIDDPFQDDCLGNIHSLSAGTGYQSRQPTRPNTLHVSGTSQARAGPPPRNIFDDI